MENIRLAFLGIWSHKMRSFLTMLGIIIGIASIITIVSTIKGTNEQIKKNLIGAGGNVVNVELYQNDMPADFSSGELPAGVKAIGPGAKNAVRNIEGVTGVALYQKREYYPSIRAGMQKAMGAVYGVDPDYLSLQNYAVTQGRPFARSDYEGFRKVVILDRKMADLLFPQGNAVGGTVELGKEIWTVIGIAEKQTGFRPVIQSMEDYMMYSLFETGTVFLPDAAWPVAFRFEEPQNMAVGVAHTDLMTKAGKEAADTLTALLVGGSGQTDAIPISEEPEQAGQEQTSGVAGGQSSGSEFSYRSQNLLEQAEQLQKLSSAANQQLIWIASISLLVGGIGVMNIMLVSVTERTGEIGLKKALGAKKRRIRLQFLTEAAVLTSVGGLMGVGIGILLSQIISKTNGIPVAISVPAITVSVLFSMAIGLVFGFLPAVKAANLSPIQALQRD